MIKNLVILFLLVVVVGLIYKGGKSTPDNTPPVSQVVTTPVVDTTIHAQMAQASPSTNPTVNPTNTPSPLISDVVSQIREIQQQISDASVVSLDQQTKNIQGQILFLKNELKSYQTTEGTVERSATTQLQFQQTMNRQKQEAISNRVRNLRRELTLLQAKFHDAMVNSDINQPDKAEQIQSQINQHQAQVKELMNQREQVSSDALDDTSALGNQLASAKNNLTANRASIQAQINFLQVDLDRIQDEKARSQEQVSFLKQQLRDKQLELKNLQ